MRAYLWSIVLLLALPVWAGTIPAPKLVPGQYVYTIPANYDPPMIGKHGLREIQQAAKKLHYPFYVVVVESIPGEDDEDAAAAIDGLVEDWARDPKYNVGTSSIFLLSFSPRKYRMLAGLCAGRTSSGWSATRWNRIWTILCNRCRVRRRTRRPVLSP